MIHHIHVSYCNGHVNERTELINFTLMLSYFIISLYLHKETGNFKICHKGSFIAYWFLMFCSWVHIFLLEKTTCITVVLASNTNVSTVLSDSSVCFHFSCRHNEVCCNSIYLMSTADNAIRHQK